MATKLKKPTDYIYKVTTYNEADPDTEYRAYVTWKNLNSKIQEEFLNNNRRQLAVVKIPRQDGGTHVIEVRKIIPGGGR